MNRFDDKDLLKELPVGFYKIQQKPLGAGKLGSVMPVVGVAHSKHYNTKRMAVTACHKPISKMIRHDEEGV